jgi:threonine aldolase
MVDLRSDNVSGIAPQILAALARANEGSALGYGGDAYTTRLQTQLAEVFEHPVEVFPVVSGTAANGLALAALTQPWSAIYCHSSAHIHNTECGAAEFFSSGAKMIPLEGEGYRIGLDALRLALSEAGFGLAQKVQPAALSLTQASDWGTLYTPDEVEALAALAHAHGLRVHMDGARLANALVSLGCTAAQMTWKAGVDLLSLGATKNGVMNADAIVCFDPALADSLRYRCRRSGHVPSKMRFLSAQLCAYLDEGLWLQLAAAANSAAQVIARGLAALQQVSLLAPVQINQIFVRAEPAVYDRVEAAGLRLYRRPRGVGRLVTSFQTTTEQAERCVQIFRDAVGG